MVRTTLRTFVLGAAALMSLSSAALAGGPATFEEAQKLADNQGKLILVDFYADWCGPCKRFAADAATNAPLGAGLEQVVLLTIDAEKGEGIALAERYGVRSYPNYLLADTSGEPIARWVGYATPEDFLATLDGNLADPTTIAQKIERYEASPNAKDAISIAQAKSAGQEHAGAVAWYNKAAAMEEGHELEIFRSTLYGARGGAFTEQQVIAAADAAMEAGDLDQMAGIYEAQGSMAKITGNEELAYRYVEAAWAMLEDNDSPEMAKMRTKVEIDYAMYIQKDGPRAAELRFASMPEGWQENPQQLNGYAWWCFENQVDLERAESLARQGAELASVGKERAMILDTVAELCNSLGECHEAVGLIEQAIENDPDNEYYQKQLTRFRELAAAQG